MAKISKILYIVTQSEWGGAQRYVFDLATNLPKDQFEAIVAAGGQGEFLEKIANLNIKTREIKNLAREINPIKDLKAYFEIKKLLREIKPDILHLNSSKVGAIGAMAGRQAEIKKIIYTAHGFVFNEPMPGGKKIIYKWAEKITAKYKDKIICVSEFDRQTAIDNKIADSKKLITVYNGIKESEFLEKNTARTDLRLNADKTVIGAIANFYAAKGLIDLIKAAKIAVQDRPDIIFIIIGDGRLKNILINEINNSGLKENFILAGKKEKAARYLKAFDIYACSSLKEGFPYSILEAMQAGLPIVSTDVGGLPEMIKNEENGLLIKPAEPKNLAEAIIKLLKNNDLAQKLGAQAKIDVSQKFSLEKMVKETEKIYQE